MTPGQGHWLQFPYKSDFLCGPLKAGRSGGSLDSTLHFPPHPEACSVSKAILTPVTKAERARSHPPESVSAAYDVSTLSLKSRVKADAPSCEGDFLMLSRRQHLKHIIMEVVLLNAAQNSWNLSSEWEDSSILTAKERDDLCAAMVTPSHKMVLLKKTSQKHDQNTQRFGTDLIWLDLVWFHFLPYSNVFNFKNIQIIFSIKELGYENT